MIMSEIRIRRDFLSNYRILPVRDTCQHFNSPRALPTNEPLLGTKMNIINSLLHKIRGAKQQNIEELPFTSCETCSNPCSNPEHQFLPSYLAKQIDQGDLKGTIKPYKLHVLLRFGTMEDWKEHIENDKVGEYRDAVKLWTDDDIGRRIGGRVVVTAYEDLEMTEESGGTEGDTRQKGIDVMLLPMGIKYTNLTPHQMRQLADKLSAEHLLPTNYQQLDSIVPGPTSIHTKVILVCAHKKRDKRCGMAGPKLVDEFRSVLDQHGLTDTPVYPVSHIGGHKYAGNVIIYPSGDWYGRVRICDVEPMVNACIIHDKIWKELWRGRINR